jgi:hypothetical protein
MKDTTVSGLLRHAQKGKPFVNQGKFRIRSYIEPPIDGEKDYPRKAKMRSCALGACYKKRRTYKEL